MFDHYSSSQYIFMMFELLQRIEVECGEGEYFSAFQLLCNQSPPNYTVIFAAGVTTASVYSAILTRFGFCCCYVT